MGATLLILRDLDVKCTCLILIKQVVKFIVCRTIHSFTLMSLVDSTNLTLIVLAKYALIVAQIRR